MPADKLDPCPIVIASHNEGKVREIRDLLEPFGFTVASAAELGLEVHRYPRKTDPTRLAAEAMGVELDEVAELVARFGREAGTPWRKDHKLAAAAALSVLGQRTRR